MFTDIHLGRKNNSEQHNQDCVDYVQWLISHIKNDTSIDHIIFLGDFFQTRSAIDISTIKYAQKICRLLNDLDMPIYMLIGNHDLYHKHSRDVHSPIMFTEFSNFIIIDEPQIRPEIGDDSFLSPYLFKHEYQTIQELNKSKVVFIHGEFNGFYVTGFHKISHENGPEPDDFTGPKFIFSGHFHQRQVGNNIVYIGNTFPFDFSDKNDNEKGLCIYDHDTEEYEFVNWKECPKFIELKLSEFLPLLQKKSTKFDKDSSINCLMDIDLSYEEHVSIKKLVNETYDFREFRLKELPHTSNPLTDTDEDIVLDLDTEDLPVLNDLVVMMLDKIESDNIDNDLLKSIYSNIK